MASPAAWAVAAPALPGTSLSVPLGMLLTSGFARALGAFAGAFGVFPFCCGFLEAAVSALLAPSVEGCSRSSVPVLELDGTEQGRSVIGFVLLWNIPVFSL